jgi:lipid II isoglutaminyl synthase (glutamine-hydrolysing)
LVMLAICGGYQLLGHYFLTHTGERLPGIGALDVHTVGGDLRLIGNIAINISAEVSAAMHQQPANPRMQASNAYLVGFENHSGRTYLGSGVTALGQVLKGHGNNGEDGSEGAVYKNTYGCYMHGSLLPKNPHFADHLIHLAHQRRYGTGTALAELNDHLEVQAQQAMITRLL